MDFSLPDFIETEAQLDEVMTRPRTALVEFMRTLRSPLLILGAGGKMGPTLAALARRAADAADHPLDVIAVSRFSDQRARQMLESQKVRTLSCDLFDRDALGRLPDSENVLYLVGLKFGTSDNPSATWAVNTVLPSQVMERYPEARISALSSGNVYPLVSIDSGGSKETDPLTPLGEYASSCVARERIFDYYARQNGTPVALIRLSYALDLRYGVIYDIARRIWDDQPVDLTTGYLNGIWQGDANEVVIRALALADSPPVPLNLTGTGPQRVHDLAERLGALMGREPQFVGVESGSAFLSQIARLEAEFGLPPTDLETVLRWTAHWVMQGGRSLNKPTHFEVRDGRY